MKAILACLLVAVSFQLSAQSYNVLLVPDTMRKSARAIIREEEMIVDIKSPSKVVTKEHHVYTILNENGDNIGGITTFYDRFTAINSVSGTLYDAMGKTVRKMKKKDMEDKSAVGNNLFDDERYKEFNFYCRDYPYTVDYEEEDEINGLLRLPIWQPLYSSGISTQHSKYVIIAPKDYKVRYKLMNGAPPPVITESGEKKVYTWEAKDLPVRLMEPHGPRWREVVPYVLLAPSEFEAQGYKGDMSTWEGYGKFIAQLRAGRDGLPDDIKRKVHELTDKLSDKRQKIYALYNFLQQNTHYISVQLGIGGWQPFPADYVATKRYGDCKALSNYMIALLKEAGITGKYVEIYSGAEFPAVVEDFPSFQSDHAIACVPMGKDTVWLECTSQTVSPDFMGSFTGGRKAILSDETGAHVVRTPSYSAADNLKCRVVTGEINADGNLEAEVNTMYTGVRQELPQAMLSEWTQEEREKYLNNLFQLPTYKVDKNQYKEQKGTIPVVWENLHVVSPNYASVSGKRLFITPNLFDRSNTRLPADSVRRYDFVDDEAFKDVDSIFIKIPAGYMPESVPSDIKIDGPFGRYTASVKVNGDKIEYYRSREESMRRFPPSDYPQLVKFYEQLFKADHNRVVLVKKE